MRLPKWIGAKAASKAVRVVFKRVRARFDSAQTTDDNRKHWGMADALSAGAAASPAVRQLLRNRSRYEVANNSYARGVVNTLAGDTVGTGVRLQMMTGNPDTDAKVEALFSEWARAMGLAEKLRTMRAAKCQDGEVFGLKTTNPKLTTEVKLDLKILEGEQVQHPWDGKAKPSMSDGIEFDKAGNPTLYWVLKDHPGDIYTMGALDAEQVDAKNVIHYFRVDRPGQIRGLPEIMPALSLFAQLRRYTEAVIGAAESAADIATTIQTDASANDGASEIEGNPFEGIELDKRLATVLPQGWKLSQFKAEQPTTTYGDFKKEVLNEIGRCLEMPFNVVAGNSSAYNYASGRLDHQVYFRAIRVEQSLIERTILDNLLAAFLDEAVRIDGLLPQSLRRIGAKTPHAWYWDGREHVDPMKEASAQGERLLNHTTTLACEYAKQGKDWQTEIEQRAKEVALMTKLGLEVPSKRAPDPNAAEPAGVDE